MMDTPTKNLTTTFLEMKGECFVGFGPSLGRDCIDYSLFCAKPGFGRVCDSSRTQSCLG